MREFDKKKVPWQWLWKGELLFLPFQDGIGGRWYIKSPWGLIINPPLRMVEMMWKIKVRMSKWQRRKKGRRKQ